jgi:hypothetical protein
VLASGCPSMVPYRTTCTLHGTEHTGMILTNRAVDYRTGTCMVSLLQPRQDSTVVFPILPAFMPFWHRLRALLTSTMVSTKQGP